MAPRDGIDNPAGPEGKRGPNDVEVIDEGEEKDERPSICKRFTNTINHALESFFGKVGYTVADHPWKTILICLIVFAICMIGITEYQVENRGEKNWVSQSADSIKHKDWVDVKFPSKFRFVNIMVEKTDGTNILTPDGLLKLYELNEAVLAVKAPGHNWTNSCFPNIGQECIPESILLLWEYNKTTIDKLTSPEILDKVNTEDLKNPYTNQPVNIKLLVGGTIEENGPKIKSATVFKLNYKIINDEVFDEGKGKQVSEMAEAWEEAFTKMMEKKTIAGHTLYYKSEWDSEEASGNAAGDDLQFFVIGYILVIVYLSLMLGSFSRINHKFMLAVLGIAVIGLSIGIAYGLGSAFQMKSTGVHNILPFLLLGIGVDDIFVITQNWDNIRGPQQDERTVPQKVEEAMKNAGVSILVTSVTDVCAFFIGATTILPALRSFCIWSGIGILAVFIYTITFFTACLAIDAKRQAQRRDACCCCVKLSEDWEPMDCAKKSYLQIFLEKYYGPALLSIPGKIIALLIIAGCLTGGIIGLLKLEQDFDFNWFLPPDSAPRMYGENLDIFFPSDGITANAYTGRIDYNKHINDMEKIYDELNNDQFVANGTVYSWHHDFIMWMYANNKCPNGTASYIDCKLSNNTVFETNFKEFLLTDTGIFFRKSVSLDKKDHIVAAKIEFKHTSSDSSSAEIEGMDSVQEVINPDLIIHDADDAELLPFVFSFNYIGYETNKVISVELRRNLALASVCVFIVALFLLSHLGTALMVLLCVVLALVDIAGFMHFWGLTVDTVTTIIMVIAIGLTVDYSAHLAHGFMAAGRGSRKERMQDALTEIGPAVIHGGMSTLLAFILLAASESYVFKTFFKVFFLVVSFGMLHGLVFLPVLLSLIGPGPYKVIKLKRRVSVAYHYETKEEKDDKIRRMSSKEPETKELPKGEQVRLEKMSTTNGDKFTGKDEEANVNQAYTIYD